MSQPLKVLLVEDNRIEARQTQQWLANSPESSFEVEWVERKSSALESLRRGGIDIVLLDLNLPDSRGLETFLTVHSQAPQVPIVVLTGETDEAVGIQAVEQGAQDYLVKNKANAGSVSRAVQYAIARHRGLGERIKESERSRVAKVLGFMGVKGGMGTTTVALNVATALAMKQKSTLLVELRPSLGTLALQLRETPAQNLSRLLKVAPERITDRELNAQLCKGPSDLRVLFGAQNIDEFNEIKPTDAVAIIGGLIRMADYIVLDLPSQPSAATQAVVRLCHFVALVGERDPAAASMGKVLLKLLKSWGVNGSQMGAILVNRTQSLAATTPAEIRLQLGCEIMGVIPPGPEIFFKAQEEGVPLVLSQPKSLPAMSFLELTTRLVADKVAGLRF